MTISGNLIDEVLKGTLNSIMKQSGLKGVEIDDGISDHHRKSRK